MNNDELKKKIADIIYHTGCTGACCECDYSKHSDADTYCKAILKASALIAAGIGDVKEAETENAALRERLEKSVEFPFKLGNRVWLFHYDEETELPDEVVSNLFIGGNKKYAFLSPRVYAGKLITKPNALCQYYFGEYKKFEDECDCDVIPYSECFKTREEAEARLAELKGEER